MDTDNPFIQFVYSIRRSLQQPVIWFREHVVEPNQQDYPFYHRQFRRVPTIDECYTDDVVCAYEAEQQYQRDKMVDDNIIRILRRRKMDCYFYEGYDGKEKCSKLVEDYEQASADYFCKYGDLGATGNTIKALMKQKHRMIWERRYGPVGSGMTRLDEQNSNKDNSEE